MSINFEATKEKATITFNGWDGKSYNGEARKMTVYTHPVHPGKRFVRTWMPKYKEYAYHMILDELHPISGVNTVLFWCTDDK